MQTIQQKILQILGGKSNGTINPANTYSKIWIYFARLSSLPEIPGNAVPFVTGYFQKLKPPKFLVEWKAPFFTITWKEKYFNFEIT